MSDDDKHRGITIKREGDHFTTDATVIEERGDPVFQRGQRVWFYDTYPGPIMGTIQRISRVAKQDPSRNALVECYRYVVLLDGDTNVRHTDDPDDMKPTVTLVTEDKK